MTKPRHRSAVNRVRPILRLKLSKPGHSTVCGVRFNGVLLSIVIRRRRTARRRSLVFRMVCWPGGSPRLARPAQLTRLKSRTTKPYGQWARHPSRFGGRREDSHAFERAVNSIAATCANDRRTGSGCSDAGIDCARVAYNVRNRSRRPSPLPKRYRRVAEHSNRHLPREGHALVWPDKARRVCVQKRSRRGRRPRHAERPVGGNDAMSTGREAAGRWAGTDIF